MSEDSLPHEFVSSECQHRLHDDCRELCEYCPARCLCVCHRWPISVERQ